MHRIFRLLMVASFTLVACEASILQHDEDEFDMLPATAISERYSKLAQREDGALRDFERRPTPEQLSAIAAGMAHDLPGPQR